MINNVKESVNWINNNETIEVKEGKIERSSLGTKIRNVFCSNQGEIKKLADFIQKGLKTPQKKEFILLADAFAKRYKKETIGKEFERAILPSKRKSDLFQ